jgi:molybdate transport system substrate-binding protein
MTRVVAWLILLTMLAGCSADPGAGADPLRIAAASDLEPVLPEIVEAFRKAGHPGRVEIVFGASGVLARQVRQGAPFDILLSADSQYIEILVKASVIEYGTNRPYAEGALSLVTAKGAMIKRLDDLLRSDVRTVALANPEQAPYGRAARQVLERADLWKQLAPKLVFAESVRQSLQYVQSGNADAGFVSRSLADQPGLNAVPISGSAHEPIVQSLGIITGTRRPREAQRFVAFLLGEEGQRMLAAHGFRPPAATQGR